MNQKTQYVTIAVAEGSSRSFARKFFLKQENGSYEFTQLEMNVIRKFEQQDEEKFGVFVIKSVMVRRGKENRKMLETEMGQNRWRIGFRIDCENPLTFISQTELHKL